VPADLKSRVESKVADLKEAAQAENVDKMKRAQEALQQEVMQIGQAIYGSGGAGAGPAQPGPAAGGSSTQTGKPGGDDAEVIDADFSDSS
jgi:hypothetical protein